MSFRKYHTPGQRQIPAWFPSRPEVDPGSLSLEGKILTIARQNGVRLKERALTPDDVARVVTVFEQTGQVLPSWTREALRLYAGIPEIRAIIRAKAERVLVPAPPAPFAPSPAPPSPPPPPPPFPPPKLPAAARVNEPIRREPPAVPEIDLAALERTFNLPPYQEGHCRKLLPEQMRAGLALYSYHCSQRNGSAFLAKHRLSRAAPNYWRRCTAQCEMVEDAEHKEASAPAPSPIPERPAPVLRQPGT